MAWVRFRPVWVKEAMVDIEMCLRLPSTLAMLEAKDGGDIAEHGDGHDVSRQSGSQLQILAAEKA